MAGDGDEAAAVPELSMKQLVETLLDTVKQNAELIKTLKERDNGPSEEAIRAEKLQKLSVNLRKSSKIKEYKDTQEMSIKEWLKKYEEEIQVLKRMSGIDGDLSNTEKVQLLKDRLDYHVIKRLESAFRNKGYAWNTVTYANLVKLLKEEFHGKVAEVCEVLIQFGPNRLKKTADVSVAKFTHQWLDQLPECIVPEDTLVANREFVDLIKKALFYYCLNDPFLQKELCDLEGPQTFKNYFDHAVLAESKRKSFTEIGTSSANLDAASGISINKWDTSGKAAGNVGSNKKTGGKNGNNNFKNGNNSYNGNFNGGSPNGNKSNGQNNSGSYNNTGNVKHGNNNPVGNPGSSNKSGGSNNINSGGNYGNGGYNGGYGNGSYGNSIPNRSDGKNNQKFGGGGRFAQQQQSQQQRVQTCDEKGTGAVPKRKRNQACFNCGQMGHWMAQCQNQSINKMEMSDGTAQQQQQQQFSFNSIQVLSVDGAQRTQYSTCPAIMTEVVVEDVCRMKFECDTAASHSIMSEDIYNGLRRQKWRVPSMKQEELVVKLADGTVSTKACGSVRL